MNGTLEISDVYDKLLSIIDKLGKEGICVLHGYENLRETISSDVDVMMTPDAFRNFLDMDLGEWRIVQCLRHEARCFFFILATWDKGAPSYLMFDVALDYRRNGCVFYEGEEILANSVAGPDDCFQVPAPCHEFGYYLVKKMCKGELLRDHMDKLSALWARDPDGCRAELCRFFTPSAQQVIECAAKSQDWAPVHRQMSGIRRGMLIRTSLCAPIKCMGYWLSEAGRLTGRCLYPTGFVFCTLGPDGAGKTTALNSVMSSLSPIFRATVQFHLRYGHRRRGTMGPDKDPHGEIPYGAVLSIVKLVYLWFSYWVGYLGIGLPLKIRTGLIVFDRYFHDIVMDPKRYRYGGPVSAARFVGHRIPAQDLYLVLDAPAVVVNARKTEVPLAETERQCRAYRDFANVTDAARLIDASQPPEIVARTAASAVLDSMAVRMSRRLYQLKIV